MSTTGCAAIILAAGMSSRMGKFKPLLPLGTGTIVERVIATFVENNVEVYVVVGHRKEEVSERIKNPNVTVVDNDNYERGMFTSVQAGVGRLRADHKCFFVMPVDIPLVRPATVARLIRTASKHPEAVVYPVFVGQRGHPVLIPSRMRQPIMQWGGDGGLRAVLSQDTDSVDVVVPDANVVFDVDSPKDYWDLTERHMRMHAPTTLECEVILNDICGVSANVRAHCLKVSEIAVLMGQSLGAAGCRLDLDAVRAGAMLHDIAKGRAHHETEGGRLVRSLGFDRIGRIIAAHTDFPAGSDPPIENKLVFLADKLVKGTELVTIEERYENSSRAFALTAEIEEEITRRRSRALSVKRELEERIGRPLEEVLLKCGQQVSGQRLSGTSLK